MRFTLIKSKKMKWCGFYPRYGPSYNSESCPWFPFDEPYRTAFTEIILRNLPFIRNLTNIRKAYKSVTTFFLPLTCISPSHNSQLFSEHHYFIYVLNMQATTSLKRYLFCKIITMYRICWSSEAIWTNKNDDKVRWGKAPLYSQQKISFILKVKVERYKSCVCNVQIIMWGTKGYNNFVFSK